MAVIHLNNVLRNDEQSSEEAALSPEIAEARAAEVVSLQEVLPKIEAVPVDSPTPEREDFSLHQGYVRLPEGMIPNPEAAERFRIMRARIERMNLSRDEFRVIAVTSAVPEEGKSLVAMNLARAMASDPLGKTILVDCDLRKPSVHRYGGLSLVPGLSNLLSGDETLSGVIRSIEPGLDVITAGSPVVDATRSVELPELADLLGDLKKQYRYVIVDCPPVLLCPEPLVLSSLVDTSIMVIRAWRTQKKLVSEAVNLLGRDRVLGIIVNGAADVLNEYGYYGYYGYEIPGHDAPKEQTFMGTLRGFMSRLLGR